MVGLGEKKEEIIETLKDIKAIDCDIVTIGQYIQPTLEHTPVDRYLHPDEYKELKEIACQIGIKKPVFGPQVRSSYKAQDEF